MRSRYAPAPQDVDRQVCELHPRTRREALEWFWGCGDYSISDALALRPLVFAPGQVRRCLRVKGRRPGSSDEFVVDFTQARHNRIVSSRLPAGFPLRIVEDGRSLDYLRALVREQLSVIPRGLTVSWFAAALVALAALQAAIPVLGPELARRAASPDCSGTCPALIAHGELMAVTGLIPILLGLLVPPLRYGWLLRRERVSAVLRATARTELLLIVGLNAVFASILAFRAASTPAMASLVRLLNAR